MDKKKLFATALTAAAFYANNVYATAEADMEKCKPYAQGKNIVKEHKSDCNTENHPCALQNKAGEYNAWILVPKGECAKINKGDFSGLPAEVKDKLAMPS